MDRETAPEKAKALARAASLGTAGIERVIVPRQTCPAWRIGMSGPSFQPQPAGAVCPPKRKARLLAGRIENIPNVMKREHLRPA